MPQHVPLIAITVLVLILPACGPSIFDLNQSDIDKLTKEEVERRYGAPDSRSRDESGEAWHYVVRYSLAQPSCIETSRGGPRCEPLPAYMVEFGNQFILRFDGKGILRSYTIEPCCQN